MGEGAAPPPKQNDNTCLCSCAVEYGTQGIHIIYIYTYIMHNMPVVSECKLNQVGIVGEPLSTSVQCPEIPLSASFLPSPSFLPSLSQIVFWDPDNIFFWCVSHFQPLPAFCLTCFVYPSSLQPTFQTICHSLIQSINLSAQKPNVSKNLKAWPPTPNALDLDLDVEPVAPFFPFCNIQTSTAAPNAT